MSLDLHGRFVLIVGLAVVVGACTPTGGSDATGGSSSHTGGSGAGTGGHVGASGGTSGGSGSGGAATGGRGSGGADPGHASGGTGVNGSGGSATGGNGGSGGGSGGRASGGSATGGGIGAGGSAGKSSGSGGATGGPGGGATGGATGGGGATGANGDDFVSDVKVTVHPQTTTILVVTWTQLKVADNTLIEFSFMGSGAMSSHLKPGGLGAHQEVVLGAPEKTDVALHIVSKQGGVDYKTKDYKGTTGALPSGLPRPQLLAYDAALASPEPWILGAVENSTGGCSDVSCYYDGLFWIFIIDRQARVVWYWADPAANASSAYPRVARDGEYIVFEKSNADDLRSGGTGVVKMTLDRTLYQTIPIAGINDAIDVTSDGSILYDNSGDLHEYTKDGMNRTIWSCSKQFPNSDFMGCYSNTVNWVPADDTVMMSFPFISTVVQIDRKTGKLVGQYGNAAGSYAFSPSPWKFQFQHSATITAQGTLLVSSHLPDYPDGSTEGPMHHAFEEFEIDRANKKLTQKWIYSEGTEWPTFKGFNFRLANGNTLVNYGTGGVIREVTADKKTVFQVKFDVPTGDDYNNKMVGNTVPIADLYTLNGGGPK